MFDIGASELLLVVVVAIVVIGPKDLPLALRAAGRWMARLRRVSAHFRTGLDAMIREAEMDELQRQWREQNEAIMKAHPDLDPGSGMPVSALEEAQAPAAAMEGPAAAQRPSTTPAPPGPPAQGATDGPPDQGH